MVVRGIIILLILTTSGICFGQKYNVLAKWSYVPLKKSFWESFEQKMNAGELLEALRLTQLQQAKTRDLERAEVDYAQILILRKMNQTTLAYRRALDLMEKAPGSMPSLGALQVVDQLAQEEDHELSDAKRIINSGVFKEVPEEIIPFVSYLVAFDYRERNYPDWTAKAEENIVPNSFWGVYFHAQDFILHLPKDLTPADLTKWQALREQARPYPRLLRIMQLQEARFLHKLHYFDKAEDLYASLKLEGREYGRVLFERSWTLYSMKQYSMALGLLQNLKSSVMRASIDPEAHLLAMIAYRDLCHYPAVRLVSRDFFKVFGPTLEVIRSGKSFEKDPVLVRMTTQKEPWKTSANEISLLKAQTKSLRAQITDKTSPEAKSFFTKAVEEEVQLEPLLIQRLHRVSAKEFDSQAEKLLAMAEQVKLLEYIADLDEYRLKKAGENRTYKSEQAEANGAEGLFWNVDGESWGDEMGTYRVLISDRCNIEPKVSR